VVGPPGAASRADQWIADRLAEDGYAIHKNLDRCHHVWRLSGKRLIAGMSRLGEWEERCLAVLEQARKRHGILWIEDLHLFGRLGQSRQSERSFADFFRGPVRRGDLAVVAELTSGSWLGATPRARRGARAGRGAGRLAARPRQLLHEVRAWRPAQGRAAPVLAHRARARRRAVPVARRPGV
jgi:hypothetical protein